VRNKWSPTWPLRLTSEQWRTPPPRWLVELALLDVAVAANSLWLSRAVSALLLSALPGQLLLRALKIPARSVRRYIAYLPCASVAVLVATSLAVDIVGPVLGVHEPLRRLPLFVGLNLALVGLALCGRHATDIHELRASDIVRRARWLWPLILPAIAVAAAVRLDNGDGNTLCFVVLIAVAVMIPVCVVTANKMHNQEINFLLYGSGLALMLLTSMRSSYVIGFDINSEYFDFHRTVVEGVWHFGHLDPYQAMLSLTVLPASLHALIGGQDVWIFKLGYPALFALFPVAVFSLGTRFLSRRAAFLAAAVVIAQSYFFEQQPEIARQELALLIFAGIIGALLDNSLRRRPQRALISVLGVTLVVCHYSTTYIAILLCLLASLLAVTVARTKRTPLRVRPWLVAAGVMTVSAFIWYVPATHSGSNVSDVAESLRQTGINLLPGRTRGENIISAYFNGPREAPSSPSDYQSSIAAYYAHNLSFLVPLAAAQRPEYNLRAATPAKIDDHAPAIAALLSDAELLVQQGINALAVLSSLLFALRRRGGRLLRIMGTMGLASLFVLTASRLSGTLAADYNSSRLFLQCLFILALLEAAFVEMLVKELKSRPLTHFVLFGGFSMVLLVAFVSNSGLATPVTGGDPPFILYNNGEDHARLYTTEQEEFTAQWLASAVPKQRIIYADYYAQLRLDQFTDLRTAVFNDVTPRTIDRNAWIFASTTNVVGDRTWGQTNSGVLDLVFPSRFLDQYFNVVYSTGSTAVFNR